MVITLGQQYNVGEKPTVILYTYVVVVVFTLKAVPVSTQYFVVVVWFDGIYPRHFTVDPSP